MTDRDLKFETAEEVMARYAPSLKKMDEIAHGEFKVDPKSVSLASGKSPDVSTHLDQTSPFKKSSPRKIEDTIALERANRGSNDHLNRVVKLQSQKSIFEK